MQRAVERLARCLVRPRARGVGGGCGAPGVTARPPAPPRRSRAGGRRAAGPAERPPRGPANRRGSAAGRRAGGAGRRQPAAARPGRGRIGRDAGSPSPHHRPQRSRRAATTASRPDAGRAGLPRRKRRDGRRGPGHRSRRRGPARRRRPWPAGHETRRWRSCRGQRPRSRVAHAAHAPCPRETDGVSRSARFIWPSTASPRTAAHLTSAL